MKKINHTTVIFKLFFSLYNTKELYFFSIYNAKELYSIKSEALMLAMCTS